MMASIVGQAIRGVGGRRPPSSSMWQRYVFAAVSAGAQHAVKNA
jgi:hypothetical protein